MRTTQKWTKERWDAWLREAHAEADRVAAGLYARQWSRIQREEQDLAEELDLAEEYDDEEEKDEYYSEE